MAVLDSAPPVAKKRAHSSKTETVTDTERRKILRREILRQAIIAAAPAISSKIETVTDTECREILRGEIVRQINIRQARHVVDVIRTAHAQSQEWLEYMLKAEK
ncbi:hypothetical protein FCM35_KLT08501 [Carex littledalei]|uniref:Uncharacterized protein n=1 Tax=Carex littledalei TaxID=544730 RepID=A0A833QYC2_9POAL|nr:hypothetical protein FCM35_KLT08501 [Carex littledalei]